eukprot:SAG31_NODE_4512_length_3176_cov_2.548261_3_plen_198_part_00
MSCVALICHVCLIHRTQPQVSFSKDSICSDGSTANKQDATTTTAIATKNLTSQPVSRYNLKERHRRSREKCANQIACSTGASWATPGGSAGSASWVGKSWSFGNERQSNQAAWRIENRETTLRPIASQPVGPSTAKKLQHIVQGSHSLFLIELQPFRLSAAAWRSDPIFDQPTRHAVKAAAASACSRCKSQSQIHCG